MQGLSYDTEVQANMERDGLKGLRRRTCPQHHRPAAFLDTAEEQVRATVSLGKDMEGKQSDFWLPSQI